MLNTAWDFTNELLGLELGPGELEMRHMAWRAFVVFLCAILGIRVAIRRLLGHNAGFDIIVAIVLGSVLSRAINGEAAFFPTIGASVLLIGLHYVLASLAFEFHWFSQVTKGRAHVLVRDGRVDEAVMRRCKITPDDLDENIRLNGGLDSSEGVAEARLERNGSISVVRKRVRDRARRVSRQPAHDEDNPGD